MIIFFRNRLQKGDHMLQKINTVIHRTKSNIGTKLLVQCGQCNKSFSESYTVCPYCGWTSGDPIINTEPLKDIMDVDMTDENGNWFQTYSIGSANGDKYAKERGGSYGHELTRFKVDLNNPEHMKLLELLDKFRDDDGCRYTVHLVG